MPHILLSCYSESNKHDMPNIIYIYPCFHFIFSLVPTSPSSKYKTIKSRISKESSHLIFQKLVKIRTSLWKVLCLLFIKFKTRTRLSLQQPTHQVFYM